LEDAGDGLQARRYGPTRCDGVPLGPGAMDEVLGERVVAALGESGARELLHVLERSDADRAALIGRLHVRDDAAWLAELLMELEDDVGEVVRLRLVDSLRRTLGAP
jgi:hypothetical protein